MLRSQSLSAVSRSDCHNWRELCRSPPWFSVTAASDFSHQGAPGISLAFVNHSPALA